MLPIPVRRKTSRVNSAGFIFHKVPRSIYAVSFHTANQRTHSAVTCVILIVGLCTAYVDIVYLCSPATTSALSMHRRDPVTASVSYGMTFMWFPLLTGLTSRQADEPLC